MKRTETRTVWVGGKQLGGQETILIQSMTNTPTKDVFRTVEQIKALEQAGCDIVRVAVLDETDAKAIRDIKDQCTIPIVADIHFDYRLALIAAESGVDKIRINPGNIGGKENVKAVVDICKKKRIPIRIGINAGSLEKELLGDSNTPTAEMMIESARKHVELLEEQDFHDIVLSFKSSDVLLTIEAYRLASQKFPYPLHLGLTEAGTLLLSTIRSTSALAPLLLEGIGDTIRISISDEPVREIEVAKQLLNALHLKEDIPTLVSCPTCGRTQYDMLPIAKEMEEFLKTINSNITVAVMGCAVNGPQEASRADIGVAGGKNEAILFKKGKIIRRVPQEDIVEELKKEILLIQEEKSK